MSHPQMRGLLLLFSLPHYLGFQGIGLRENLSWKPWLLRELVRMCLQLLGFRIINWSMVGNSDCSSLALPSIGKWIPYLQTVPPNCWKT